MKIPSLIALASVVLPLAACGGEPGEPQATVTVTVTPSQGAEAAGADQSGEDQGADHAAFGETQTVAGLDVTVEEYRRAIPHDEGDVEPGQRADAVLLRVCNKSHGPDPEGEAANPFNLMLVDGDYGEYDILDLSPSPAPQPQWSSWKVIAEGGCYKGWSAYDLPKNVQIKSITYTFDGSALTWKAS